MEKEKEVIMAIQTIYNKVGWLNRVQLLEKNSLYHSDTYTSSEIFCIEYIGNHIDANGKKLADACYMTRSGLSKLTRKMIKKGLIESYKKPDNKKEVCFRLTAKGKEIYDFHEEMTRSFLARDHVVFEKMTSEQIEALLTFFHQYNDHLDEEFKKIK